MPEPNDQDLNKAATDLVKNKKGGRKAPWTIIGIVVLVLLLGGGISGGYVLHLSNTSPEFCGVCHIMQSNVTSYLTSNNLDNIHKQANVGCKQCHDYPVTAEISSGIKFITGNYSVDANGKLTPVTFNNDMCLKCHISYDHVAKQTDFLTKNPHDSHNGQLPCSTCHVSHGKQIDFCAQCHDNGGQKMIGAD